MSANNNAAAATVLAGSLLSRYILMPLCNWRAWRMATADLTSLDEHTLADIGIIRGEVPGIVVGKIVPRRAASDGLRDCGWVKAWRQDEECGLSARSRIRWRLSMLGLVLVGDAMILGAVLFLTGVV